MSKQGECYCRCLQMGRLPLRNLCDVLARVQRIATTDEDGATGRCEAGIACVGESGPAPHEVQMRGPQLSWNQKEDHATFHSTHVISDTCIFVHWHEI
eukprot:1569964-Pyramimonas_sp.AAC.1